MELRNMNIEYNDFVGWTIYATWLKQHRTIINGVKINEMNVDKNKFVLYVHHTKSHNLCLLDTKFAKGHLSLNTQTS